MFPILLSLLALLITLVTTWAYKWRNSKCTGVLPPGSMGWPLLGETLQFIAPTTTSDLHPFINKRIKKYGPVFKTSLMGKPMIVSTDADLNYLIFKREGDLFECWYPDTFTQIFWRQNASFLHGFMFKYLKNMVLNLFGPESLKS